MNELLGFLLSLLTPFQWTLVGLGCTLLFWPAITGTIKFLFGGSSSNNSEMGDLTTLVADWEALSKRCHSIGLHEACKQMDEVFPLLLEAHKKEHENAAS